MTAYYELWDVDSGNSLGTYETEAEALAVVRVLMDAYGTNYANDLDLGYVDEHEEGRHVAAGSLLVERVNAARPEPAAANAPLHP